MKSELKTIDNLRALYKADFSHIPESVMRSLEATEEIQELRQDIKLNIPDSDWTIIRLEILKQMQQLLDIELYPILIDSWKTHQDVSREIATQKQSSLSDDISILNLTPHEIKSTHTPCLAISIGDKTHLMKCFIGMTLKLNDVSLTLNQGRIQEVLSGTVSGNGFMQYQNATLIEKDFLDFDISGITAPVVNKKVEDRSTTAELKSLGSETPSTDPVSPLHPQSSGSVPHIAPANPDPQRLSVKPKISVFSKLLQFLVGIGLALFAVYLFWKLR